MGELKHKWKHVTLSLKDDRWVGRTAGKLEEFLKLMDVEHYMVGIDGKHIHCLYRGFYLNQRGWSNLLRCWSFGSQYVFIKSVGTDEHHGRTVNYIEESCKKIYRGGELQIIRKLADFV